MSESHRESALAAIGGFEIPHAKAPDSPRIDLLIDRHTVFWIGPPVHS